MKSILASASWDKTVRLWDMVDSWRTTETLALTSDGKLHRGVSGRRSWPRWEGLLVLPVPAVCVDVSPGLPRAPQLSGLAAQSCHFASGSPLRVSWGLAADSCRSALASRLTLVHRKQ